MYLTFDHRRIESEADIIKDLKYQNSLNKLSK